MLPEYYKGFRIREFSTLPSTNTYLTQLAKEGEPDGLVAVADSQTAGRGRQGRSFYCEENTGLYMSVLVRRDLKISDSLLITPAVAVAVSEALEKASGMETGIKWVNDIFCDGKKVCGILVESKLDFVKDKMEYSVIGIGINICEPRNGYPEEIKTTAGAVFKEYSLDKRNEIILLVLENIQKQLDRIESRGFLEEYRKRLVLKGKEITVMKDNLTYDATALDIDDNCRLIVRSERGEETLESGEVRVRAKKF